MTIETEDVISDEEMDGMRTALKAIAQRGEQTQQDLAAESGIAYGTFNNWWNGRYPGDNQKVARRVRRFLAARAERAKATTALPRSPGFQMTPTAKRVLSVLTYAQARSTLAVIAGGPGIGKTSAVRHYAGEAPNVWVVPMTPSTGRLSPALSRIAAAVGSMARNPAALFETLLAKFDGTRGLVVLDDAQHLESRTIDELRAFPDQVDVGVALVGNATVYARLEGDGRKPEFAQLFSRISARLTQPRPNPKDVEILLDAWGVHGSGERALLRSIADKPGALRQMVHTLENAMVFAAGDADADEGDVAVTSQHIRDAWAQLNQVEGATL